MKIWIDLDNSPHVLLFAPIIGELQRHGVEVLVTIRDFSQTRGLAERHGLQFTTIGQHSNSSWMLRKVANTMHRAWNLRRFVRSYHVAAAVSHGSRSLVLAARSLGVPVLTLDDYEFSSLRMIQWFSDKILVPEVIPECRLAEQGMTSDRVARYPGLKEEVYVYDFRPDSSVMEQLQLDPERVIITVRPPATWAHYHDALGEFLFRALLKRLDREPDVQVVLSARTENQAQELRQRYGLTSEKYHIYSHAVDGLSLMWFSDAVFSGGGTMVRESALLGILTYSVFGGRMGAADEHLAAQGRLRLLRTTNEIDNLPLPTTRTRRPSAPNGRSMAPFIAQEVLRFIDERSNAGILREQAPLAEAEGRRLKT